MPSETYGKEYFNRHKYMIGGYLTGGYEGYSKHSGKKYWKWQAEEVLKYEYRGNALDVGCAYGFFLQHLPDSFKRYGIDLSPYAIEQAKKRGLKGKFVVADVTKERPFRGVKFDVVTLFDTLEHLRNLDFVLNNVKSMLKKDGHVFVLVPVSSKFHHLVSALGVGLLNNDVSHVNITKTESWLAIFEDFFDVVDHFPITVGKRYVWPFEIYHFFVLKKP